MDLPQRSKESKDSQKRKLSQKLRKRKFIKDLLKFLICQPPTIRHFPTSSHLILLAIIIDKPYFLEQYFLNNNYEKTDFTISFFSYPSKSKKYTLVCTRYIVQSKKQNKLTKNTYYNYQKKRKLRLSFLQKTDSKVRFSLFKNLFSHEIEN